MGSQRYTVLILAGGKSSRFRESTGKNKLYYEINGKSMLERVINLAGTIGNHTIISVNSRSQQETIEKVINTENLEFVIDNTEFSTIRGPLNGIITATRSVQNSVVVLPVDYPYLQETTVKILIREYEENNTTLAVFASPNRQIHNLLLVLDPSVIRKNRSVFYELNNSRVSNLIRSYPEIIIVRILDETNDFVNMNRLKTQQPSHIPIRYETEIIEPRDLFYRIQQLDQEEINNKQTIELLEEELELWAEYSIKHHIFKDINRYSN